MVELLKSVPDLDVVEVDESRRDLFCSPKASPTLSLPATVHSASVHCHRTSRLMYSSGLEEVGVGLSVVLAGGKEKDEGGETGLLLSSALQVKKVSQVSSQVRIDVGTHQLGLSWGRSAAVQSNPIHHR